MQGVLRLRFRPGPQDMRRVTVVDTLVQTPPLRVVRPFVLPDGAALVHLHNLSGGILGGDRLSMAVELLPGARAQLTTTGASRIYGRRQGIAWQENTFAVGAGGLLEYLPDPVIPYAGSAYRQRTQFVLGPDAGLFAWEMVAPGREAHGECFGYESFGWEWEVLVASEAAVRPLPIAVERVLLEPARRPLLSVARLGPYRYMATLLVCRAGDVQWERVERALSALAEQIGSADGVWWGVSTLSAHGVVVKGLGQNGRQLLDGLPQFWRLAKELLYAEKAILPRKIY